MVVVVVALLVFDVKQWYGYVCGCCRGGDCGGCGGFSCGCGACSDGFDTGGDEVGCSGGGC